MPPDFPTRLPLRTHFRGCLLGGRTGAIAGNILGAMHGDEVFSREALDDVELREKILNLADDLYDAWEGQPSVTDRYAAPSNLSPPRRDEGM